jgi:hypothetical protein
MDAPAAGPDRLLAPHVRWLKHTTAGSPPTGMQSQSDAKRSVLRDSTRRHLRAHGGGAVPRRARASLRAGGSEIDAFGMTRHLSRNTEFNELQ